MAAWEKDYKKIEKQVKESTEAKKKATEKIIDTQFDAAKKAIDAQRKALPDEYRPLYDASEVQKIVDRRNILNRMTNLGATNSGMSDSMTAAVELSAGNRAQALNAQQRAALDKLKQSLIDLQTKATAEKTAQLTGIQSQADQFLAQARADMSNAYTKAQADRAAAEAQARAKAAEAEQKRIYDLQNNLIKSLTSGGITPEQYNQLAPALGLAKLEAPAAESYAPPAKSESSTAQSQLPYSPNYSASEAVKVARDAAWRMERGEYTPDQALDFIITYFQNFPNADAYIERAARELNMLDRLQTRLK